ncbi:MAG: TetR/AcrR family transcriptional regulator [Ornithinimicrobium sp.]|uniref:TetR/AcrR family transcriptional regulator n=1 Tax=Ornithinimicrobium sp. TaxID=1977084 RepID=UPI003D9B2979
MSPSELGLRARKKAMTRDAIAQAALRLTVTHGLGYLTIDRIAEAAIVSPRTVTNYFPGKEAALVAAASPDMGALTLALRARPADEPVLHSLSTVFVGQARSRTPAQVTVQMQVLRLLEQHPTLWPYRLAEDIDLERSLSTVIAGRTRRDETVDLMPTLVGAAAVAAVRSALRLWGRSEGASGALPDLIEEAFANLASGCDHPAATFAGARDDPSAAGADRGLPVGPTARG